MLNYQLIEDLCTLNNIGFKMLNDENTLKFSNCENILNFIKKRKNIFIIEDKDYNHIIIKKDKLFIFGPFEKDNLLIYENAKLLFFLFFNKIYNKNIDKVAANISCDLSDLIDCKRVIKPIEINLIDFIEESIKTGDIEALKLYIKIMFISLIIREKDISSFRLQKNLVIYIFSYIFSTIDKNNIDPDFNVFLTTIITSEFEFCENSSQLLFKTYQLIDKISDSFNFTIQKSNQKIREAKFYINNNLEKKLTLDKVAKQMGISAKYLSTLFFEVTNTTFKEYVNRQRIDKARNLLSYSNKSISEISKAVGIKSPNNFISFFKRYTSKTPNSFREESKC